MGWMKHIMDLAQDDQELKDFERLYLQTLEDEEHELVFRGTKITINQAEGILKIVCDFKA